MPFTPAHAAAAVPLSRLPGRLPLSALVLGTMAPDFEYLLRLAPRGTFAHSLLGVVVFCVPATVVTYVLYERLLRPALLESIPVDTTRSPTRLRLGSAALAGALGALTHVVWDGFTHATGWAAVRIPALQVTAVTLGGRDIAWYKVLQHGSTLVGGAIVTAFVIVSWRRSGLAGTLAPLEIRRVLRGAAVVLVLAAIAGVANGFRALSIGSAAFVGFAVVGSMAALAGLLVAYALWAKVRRE